MVVQCPSCRSRFRVADEKVTDRGVRVRCSNCKEVFSVKKPGAAEAPPAPSGGTFVITPRSGTRRVQAKPAGAAGKSRLDADDLFGMSELTGDAAPKPDPSFEGIDLELPDVPAGEEGPDSAPPMEALAVDPFDGGAPEPKTPPKVKTDKQRPGTDKQQQRPRTDKQQQQQRPNTDKQQQQRPRTDKQQQQRPQTDKQQRPRTDKQQQPVPPPPERAASTRRDLLASALTGLVGAALAVIVVVVAAVSDEGASDPLGSNAGSDVVATRVVSGLYDTASGKPVFFVRGRVENRSKRPRGPVKVIAELVADNGADAKAEALAGAEPAPEDVWRLRSAAEADKLSRALQTADANRKLLPGASLPFFAVIADPPADLHRHRLQLRLEPIDAWSPPRAEARK